MTFEFKTMDDLIDEISMGPFGSDVKVEYFTDSGVPVLNGSNLTGYALNDNEFHFMGEERVNTMKKAVAKRGDVVITHRGTLGQAVYVPEDSKYLEYLISQSQFRVKFKSSVLPEYVVYYLHSKEGQAELLSNASQVGVPSLARPTSTFRLLRIPVPNILVQKSIVKIISDIQRKIKLNSQINRNLEQQATARYHSIFDDIEPTVSLNNIPFSLETGKRPTGGIDPECKDVPSIGAENVKSLGMYDYSKTKFISKDYYSNMKKGKSDDKRIRLYIYKDGGTPGNYIPHFSLFGKGFPFDEFSINEHVFQVDFGDEKLNAFAYYFFNTDEVRYELEVRGGKAAIPGIGQTAITDLNIYDLSSKEVQEFSGYAKAVADKVLMNCVENAKLTEIRDYLLPKLMSGEIDVSDLPIPS